MTVADGAGKSLEKPEEAILGLRGARNRCAGSRPAWEDSSKLETKDIAFPCTSLAIENNDRLEKALLLMLH